MAKRLEQANLEIISLEARLDAISKAQDTNATSQAAMAKQLSDLNKTIAAQSKDFEAIHEKLGRLGRFGLNSEVTDVITEASPAEFSPTTGWEFVEEHGTKGQPRKFILARQSSLVAKSGSASLTWKIADPDKRTVIFEGFVADAGVVQRMEGLCAQRGINCLMNSVFVRPSK